MKAPNNNKKMRSLWNNLNCSKSAYYTSATRNQLEAERLLNPSFHRVPASPCS